MESSTILTILTILFGGTNIVQLVLLKQSWRREKALSNQEEANSVGKTQEIFDKMTAIYDRELEKITKKMYMLETTSDTQQQLIESQKGEISKLKTKIDEYQKRCAVCVNNKA
jgi:predicted RNase H-like nuclease (RuvC/YqgF family)